MYGEAKGGGTFKGKLKLISRTFSYIHSLKKVNLVFHINKHPLYYHYLLHTLKTGFYFYFFRLKRSQLILSSSFSL